MYALAAPYNPCFIVRRFEQMFCGEQKVAGATCLYLAGIYIYLAGCHNFPTG
jgi:hypothetical protein